MALLHTAQLLMDSSVINSCASSRQQQEAAKGYKSQILIIGGKSPTWRSYGLGCWASINPVWTLAWILRQKRSQGPNATLCTRSGLLLLGIRRSPVTWSSVTALQNLALEKYVSRITWTEMWAQNYGVVFDKWKTWVQCVKSMVKDTGS